MTVFYPNDRRNPAGAIPVYTVAQPPAFITPPRWQNNANSAIPVRTVAGPPLTANAGPIPVRVVVGPGTPPFSSSQGSNDGAIPVFESISPKAMLVWDIIPPPLPPPIVNPVTFGHAWSTMTPPPSVIGTCTCLNGPAQWTIINPDGLSLGVGLNSGQLVLLAFGPTGPGTTFHVVMEASNANGFSQDIITVMFT